MSLSKSLSKHYSNIYSIRKMGKNIISIMFKFRDNANRFIEDASCIPLNWLAYIPNFKIFRSAAVRGVDTSLSVEEILQGIKFFGQNIHIKSITRLKFRDRNNNNQLTDSSTIKIEFMSDLLPESRYGMFDPGLDPL